MPKPYIKLLENRKDLWCKIKKIKDFSTNSDAFDVCSEYSSTGMIHKELNLSRYLKKPDSHFGGYCYGSIDAHDDFAVTICALYFNEGTDVIMQVGNGRQRISNGDVVIFDARMVHSIAVLNENPQGKQRKLYFFSVSDEDFYNAPAGSYDIKTKRS